MSQMPTKMRIHPPHFFTFTVSVRSVSTSRSCAKAIDSESANIRIVIISAAATKEVNAAGAPPIVNACPARPARIGPVQPKPAIR